MLLHTPSACSSDPHDTGAERYALIREKQVQIGARRPLFDQMILNRYGLAEGLKPHVDLLQFQDGICIVSVGSSAVLTFDHLSREAHHRVCSCFSQSLS